MKFSIEKVGKLTGIPAVTLRNWEKRYGFPCPERADSGHRFYSCKDVEFLKCVNELLSSGHNLSQIAEFYKKTLHEQEQTRTNNMEIVDDVNYRLKLLYDSLIGFNSVEALGHYNILNAKLSPEKFFDRVIEVILRKLGQDWLAKKITIAQEHFASSFLRLRLMSFLCMDLPVVQSQRILCATLSNERHEGGLLLVSAHLKFRGYPVHYFGPDLPVQELIQLVQAMKPHVLLLSYVDQNRFLEDLKYIQKLNVKICVGGVAFFDPQFCVKIQKKLANNIIISTKSIGSEAASFVEMICQSL